MPLYTYECAPCKATDMEMRLVDERHDTPICFRCKRAMKLVVTPVAGIVKNPAVPRRVK